MNGKVSLLLPWKKMPKFTRDIVIDIEKQIKLLRNQGKSLAEISKITGKSIYYIYSRLNNRYRLGRLESKYISDKVVPYLNKKGYKEIKILSALEGDIIAKKDGITHIFEVKKDAQRSLLCFAIGEIILNRMNNDKIKGKKEYHIILPNTFHNPWRVEDSNFLKKEYDIEIIFV